LVKKCKRGIVKLSVEYTTNIWNITDGDVLDISNGILLESLSIDDHGIFPNSFDWLQFISKVNDYGCTFLIENWLGVDYGKVEPIEGKHNQALYTFDRPITITRINGNFQNIISDVTKLLIQVNYEWSYSNSGEATKLGVASILDIYGLVLEVN
jgi:hypothetical protein